jgi:hypothetical protein
MTSEQFCYWLQGRAELVNNTPSEQEWKIIKNHLSLVFTKVTPNIAPFNIYPYKKEEQAFC